MTLRPRGGSAFLGVALAAYALTHVVLSAPPEPPFRFVDVAAKAAARANRSPKTASLDEDFMCVPSVCMGRYYNRTRETPGGDA